MITETISYQADGVTCQGYLAYKDSKHDKPFVLISPTWKGLDEFIKDKAHELAELGYNAFGVDIFGNGKFTADDDEAATLMMPLFLDRAGLRKRIMAAYLCVNGLDPKAKIAAIGFCFGGTTVLELLKSGAKLQATVSFHGVLGLNMAGQCALPGKNADKMYGSVLILHGSEDPLAPMHDLVHLQDELTAAKLDWQTHIFGNATHAFTNPQAHDKSSGMCFDPLANKRSFQLMRELFKEKLS